MALLVVQNAILKCSFGSEMGLLGGIVLGDRKTTAEGHDAADIEDAAPGVHFLPFGKCSSPKNPVVIEATAKNKKFTPMPCTPFVTTPWSPGASKVSLKKIQALGEDCKLSCAWAGEISVKAPGQSKVTVK